MSTGPPTVLRARPPARRTGGVGLLDGVTPSPAASITWSTPSAWPMPASSVAHRNCRCGVFASQSSPQLRERPISDHMPKKKPMSTIPAAADPAAIAAIGRVSPRARRLHTETRPQRHHGASKRHFRTDIRVRRELPGTPMVRLVSGSPGYGVLLPPVRLTPRVPRSNCRQDAPMLARRADDRHL